jgi:hypothetical protein
MTKSAFFLAGLLMCATEARADDKPTVRYATQLMKEGKELFGRSQFEYARQRFARACLLVRTPACISGLAITELRAGKPLDAYRHFQELTRDPQTAASVPGVTADVLPKMKAEAYAQIGHIDVEAPAGVQVRLDGAVVGAAPLQDSLDVDAGDHTIDAERAREHGQITIHAIAGQIVHASFTFDPPDMTASTPPILLPAIAAPAPVITPPFMAVAPVQTESPPFWTSRHTYGVIIAGVGAVALGVGALFTIAGRNASDRANNLRANVFAADPNGTICGGAQAPAACSDLENAYGEQSRDRALSLVFFAVGGASLLAGTTVFLWPDAHRSDHIALVPVIEPHSGGFQLQGGF